MGVILLLLWPLCCFCACCMVSFLLLICCFFFLSQAHPWGVQVPKVPVKSSRSWCQALFVAAWQRDMAAGDFLLIGCVRSSCCCRQGGVGLGGRVGITKASLTRLWGYLSACQHWTFLCRRGHQQLSIWGSFSTAVYPRQTSMYGCIELNPSVIWYCSRQKGVCFDKLHCGTIHLFHPSAVLSPPLSPAD